MADMVGAFIIIVPARGLLSPAAWKHEPASFSVILRPAEKIAGAGRQK
jgi:hypothetical protein